MDNIEEVYLSLSKGDSLTISVIASIVLLFITILYLTCRSSSSKRCVLLTGVCDSGKTLLFSRLLRKQFKDTYTSIKENNGTYQPTGTSKGKALGLVDVPGHERLRQACLDKYSGKARAIIFAIDSSTVQKEIKDVAEYLYQILSNKAVHDARPALLIACNKNDLSLIKGPKVIQMMLEREISLLRVTQSAMLDSTSDSSAINTVFIGKKGDKFEFKDLKMKVQFCECSARGNKEGENADITDIEDWLANVA